MGVESWTNLTTAVLNNIRITNIMAQMARMAAFTSVPTAAFFTATIP